MSGEDGVHEGSVLGSGREKGEEELVVVGVDGEGEGERGWGLPFSTWGGFLRVHVVKPFVAGTRPPVAFLALHAAFAPTGVLWFAGDWLRARVLAPKPPKVATSSSSLGARSFARALHLWRR